MRRVLQGIRGVEAATRAYSTRGASHGGNRIRTAAFLLGGASVAAAGGAVYYLKQNEPSVAQIMTENVPQPISAAAVTPQPSAITGTKEHALYLWISLKPDAPARQCAKVMSQLQKFVDEVCPPSMKDEDDEVFAGVGFGPTFYRRIGGKTAKHNFTYAHRRGPLGDMPSSPGDIFIHAKCHQQSKLFELVQIIMRELPKGSVDNFEDIYGWVYKYGRDLSGFIDGTENPADDDSRSQVALDKDDGGAYVITQKWLHQHDVINSEKDRTLENWVGRQRSDSTEQSRKSISAHVARMTGGNAFQQKKKFEIVRQSQPFGNLSGESGLFFIAYAESPTNFNYMLDRMVGAGEDSHSDDIMRLTKNIKGTYWYFPGMDELKTLA